MDKHEESGPAGTDQALSAAIVDFLNERADKKEETLLKGDKKNPGFLIQLQSLIETNLDSLTEEDKESFKNIKKAKKTKEQSTVQFQREQYQRLVELADKAAIPERDANYRKWDVARAENQEKHCPSVWLTEHCKNAHGVSFATHVAKLTHSSISKATNIYDHGDVLSERYLVTASLIEKPRDDALDDAKYSPVAKLLKLVVDGVTLAEKVLENDVAPFVLFSDNKVEIQEWMSNLKQAFLGQRKSSHTLAKQIYWPVDINDYHLLLPLKSSSMAHRLHLHFSSFFDEPSQKAREQRSKGKYSSENCVYYPNKAVVMVTSSPKAHVNVSPLNVERKGRLGLLSCAPPEWKNGVSLPIGRNSLFGYEIEKSAQEFINQLQKYLLALKINQAGIKRTRVFRHIQQLVKSIAVEVFDYVLLIQELRHDEEWLNNTKLKPSHLSLLNIFCDEKEPVNSDLMIDWQKEVAQDFGEWLNKQLRHKHLRLNLIHAGLWRDIFLPQLRSFVADMEVER